MNIRHGGIYTRDILKDAINFYSKKMKIIDISVDKSKTRYTFLSNDRHKE